MSEPEFKLSMQVTNELRRAEQLGLQGQWTEADARYSAAIKLDKTPGSRIAFGSSLASREQYNGALCCLAEALDQASKSGDREALGVIYHNLAAIYRELGDYDLARRFQQRSILQLDDCRAVDLLGLANDAWLSRRSEMASCLASSCTELDSDDELDSVLLEAQATLAITVGLAEDPRQGIRSLIQVYRQHRAANDVRLMGIDLLNLSALLSELGWYRAEMDFVRRAISLFDQAPAPVSAVKARQTLGLLERMHSLRNFDPSKN